MTLLGAAIGALALVVSASSGTAAAPTADSAEAAAVDEKVLVRNFDLDSSQLKYLGENVRCPAHAPYLNSHEYHPNSGYLIPHGVSLEGDLAEPLLPNFPPLRANEGLGEPGPPVGLSMVGSIHNLSRQSPRYVQVYIHCTDQR